nr:ESF1 [Cryptomonas curvata]
MEILIRYYTLSFSKKILYSLQLRKKNDSDVNINIKKKKNSDTSNVFYRTKTFSKNLLLLNINQNVINSADIYAFLIPFIPKNGKLISVSVISFFKNIKYLSKKFIFPDFKNFPTSNFENEFVFGLIECDCIKTSKSIFRRCNGLELTQANFLIDIRFVPKLNKSYLKIIDCVNGISNEYFPNYITNKKKKSTSCTNQLSNQIIKFPSEKSKYIISKKISKLQKVSLLNFNKKTINTSIFEKFLKKKFDHIDKKNVDINLFSIKDIDYSNCINVKFKNTDG